MSYFDYGAAPPRSPGSPTSPTGSTERSVKSCYAVVYHLSPDRKWVVSGEGGWSEVHLCCDHSDFTHRLLAWTVKNQTVLLNANVTADCTYKEKSKNFHSFQDENGQRYGLGFHKSDSGLRQAEHFFSAVVHIISECKEKLEEMEEYAVGGPPPLPTTTSPPPTFASPPPVPLSMATASTHSPPASYGGGTAMRSSTGTSPRPGPPPLPPGAVKSPIASASSRMSKPIRPPPAPVSPPIASGGLPKFTPDDEPYVEPKKSAPRSPPVSLSSAFGRLTSPKKTRSMRGTTETEDTILPSLHTTRGYKKVAPKGVPKLGGLSIHPPKPSKMGGKHDTSISDVTSVERKVVVTYDTETGQFAGLPAEWLKKLQKQFGIAARFLPGTKLPLYPAKIPTVLLTLKKALKDGEGYKQMGIFRLAPSAELNDLVKKAIDSGEFDFRDCDVNVFANLIKVWFRDLPTPLLACANPDMVESAFTEAAAVKIIADFPEPNKSIFLWLCDLCVEVAEFEKINKMGPKNLSIVIGPNLFDATVFDNPMRAMTYSGKIVDFFEKAIVWRRGT